jgi:cell division protein ZapA (FtsZ GTPase activity inhibitor)
MSIWDIVAAALQHGAIGILAAVAIYWGYQLDKERRAYAARLETELKAEKELYTQLVTRMTDAINGFQQASTAMTGAMVNISDNLDKLNDRLEKLNTDFEVLKATLKSGS